MVRLRVYVGDIRANTPPRMPFRQQATKRAAASAARLARAAKGASARTHRAGRRVAGGRWPSRGDGRHQVGLLRPSLQVPEERLYSRRRRRQDDGLQLTAFTDEVRALDMTLIDLGNGPVAAHRLSRRRRSASNAATVLGLTPSSAKASANSDAAVDGANSGEPNGVGPGAVGIQHGS